MVFPSALDVAGVQSEMEASVAISAAVNLLRAATGSSLVAPAYEEGRLLPHLIGPNLDQSPVEHTLDGFRKLRLAPLRAISPDAQKQAVGQFWLLPKLRHQFEANQVTLLRGERRQYPLKVCEFPNARLLVA
jgi:hypothetical protein